MLDVRASYRKKLGVDKGDYMVSSDVYLEGVKNDNVEGSVSETEYGRIKGQDGEVLDVRTENRRKHGGFHW